MRTVSLIAVALLMGSLCRAQLTPAQLQRVREVQKELQKKFTPARSPSVPSHVRTQNTYVVDSLYNDLYDSGTSSWQENLLHTYDYYPNSTLLRTDSLFRRDGSRWVDSAETRYYYTTTGKDSIEVSYVSPDGTTWEPSDSAAYSYTTSGSVTLETILYYEYDNSAWKPSGRQRTWYSNNRPDSSLAETYDDNTGSWYEFFRTWFKYRGGQLDSVIAYFRFDFAGIPASIFFFQKYHYDAASRPNYIQDTAYFSVPGVGTIPVSASEQFITYTTSTSQQKAVDSLVTREYSNPSQPPTQTVVVTRYRYDANNNLKMIVYEDCAPACKPSARERYAYKLVPSALVPGKGSTYSLCGRACESLTLPQGWEGLPYELYNLGGQKLSQGTLGSSLTLPAQPGLYILLTRGQAYRLQVLP